jgi:hypothetical protein
MRRRWMLLLVAARGLAVAQEGDEAALELADRVPDSDRTERVCRGFAEGAVDEITRVDAGAPLGGGRLSFDLRCDGNVSHDLRVAFSDRLDGIWQQDASGQTINTLKDAYLSWQAPANQIFDVGRINVRQGVAQGYNPTDYFRAAAIRVITSPDPASLRENRLGTAMLRSQTLWSSGSLTAIYAPKLAAHPNAASFNPDLGATNADTRWSLALTQSFGPDLKPQILLFGARHHSPQAGVNLTHLVGNATVAFFEGSAGRSRTDLAAAVDAADASLRCSSILGDSCRAAFHSRLAGGVMFTTASKLSVTLEYEYNGAGLSLAQWNDLRSRPGEVYSNYRVFVSAQQELPTQHNVFAYARWEDAFIKHLDLNGFAKLDPGDHSRTGWLEARHHWQHVDLAVQWQRNDGSLASDLGGLQRQLWVVVADYYF